MVKLYTPPHGEGIDANDWKNFVISRMSAPSQQKSEEMKEIRAKNIHPHRISRRGYAGLREDLRGELKGDPDSDRAFLWKQARVNKNGEFEGDSLKEVATRIDDLLEQKENGEQISTSGDILSQALEKSESRGRLRGVGAYVSPTTYFGHSKGKGVGNVMHELKMEFGKQLAEMNAKILELQQQVNKKELEDKDSCTGKSCHDDVEEILRENVKQVDKVKKDKAMIHPTKMAKITNANSVPKALKRLHAYARVALNNDNSFHTEIDAHVFGSDQQVYIFFDDIHNICELEPISASCICMWIWHLYKECESRNLLDRVRFVNPNQISHNLKIDQEEKANIVIQRVTDILPNQLLLIPCNVGWHWILMVMDPHNETTYVLDPLRDDAHYKEWKIIMTTVQRRFNMNMGVRGRNNPLFDVVKCQQQPDGKQCGFYVMRYMMDIVENCGTDQPIPIPSLFNDGLFTCDEIDEVRAQWADFVHDLIDNE